MKKTYKYRYLGTNGMLETPIHIEGVYSVRLIAADADEGKIFEKDGVRKTSIVVPEDEFELWAEVDA